MASQGSNDDCYFYFYSSCTKGEDCPYRHSQAALGTETVCSSWREGRCFRSNCKFRHMESRINRSSIPCYWENQPGGCRKPHCVFLHQKFRSTIDSKSENQGLILPISTGTCPPNTASKGIDCKDQAKSAVINTPLDNYSNHSDDVNMSPHPVEPFVVSFDEGEESDSESVSSTPVKSASSESKYDSTAAKRNFMNNLSEKPEDTNFGIKTLEQIRMEKIHKESEHFYKSDDATGAVIPSMSPGIDRSTSFLSDKVFSFPGYDAFLPKGPLKRAEIMYKPECYPLESEFIPASDRPTVLDKPTNSEPTHQSSENERDLRRRLMKRKATPSYGEKNIVPTKKTVSTKSNGEDAPLNFKIKTLDEIRKERENKSGVDFDSASSNYGNSMNSVPNHKPAATNKSSVKVSVNGSNLRSISLYKKPERLNETRKSNGRLKIKRHFAEPAMNNGVLNEVSHAGECSKKENRPQMILHEVQNISEDQTKTDINKAKRKEIDGPSGRSAKYLKSSSSSLNSSCNGISATTNETLNNSVNDKPVKKVRRPIIKRKSSTSSPLSTLKITLTADEPNQNGTTLIPTIKDNETPLKSKSPHINSKPAPIERKPSLEIEVCSVSSTKNEACKDNKTVRTPSMDEFESLLLTDGDIGLDDLEGTGENESEDILLEVDQLLNS